jgi:hypothetical protein
MNLIAQYSTVIIYALAVLAALIVVLMVWRGFSQRVRGRRGQRLGISEYHELDQTRRLVLVRRDNVEHLILIGGPADVVVETGIGLPLGANYTAAPDSETDASARPAAIRPAPRPAVFGDRRPPPLRTVERSDPPLAGSRPRDPEQP